MTTEAKSAADEALSKIQEMLGGLEGERGTLIEARDQVEVEITELEERRDEYNAAIEKVDQLLGPLKSVPQPRARGVKKTAETVIREMHQEALDAGGSTINWHTQDAIVQRACDSDEVLKPHSVVSALGRLVDEEVIIIKGKRGSREYALVAEEGQSTASTEKSDAGPVEPAPEPSDVVLGKLRDEGESGCSKKDLAWAVGDTVNLDGVLDRLIRSGDVKENLKAEGGPRYFIAPRVQEQKPLFAGAEEPEAESQTAAPA